MTQPPAAAEPAFSVQGFPSTTPAHLLGNITAAAASARLVLLGYRDGGVALFDVLGHLVEAQPARHPAPVTAVALGGGATGDAAAASAAADASVRATVLLDGGGVGGAALGARGGLRARAAAPVAALAVDPAYGRGGAGERVAHADANGRVVLFRPGWFGGTDEVVAKPDGPVSAMRWSGFLLAWATPAGVRIYDTRLGQTLALVEAPDAPPLLGPSEPSPANSVIADEDFGVGASEAHDAPSSESGAKEPPADEQGHGAVSGEAEARYNVEAADDKDVEADTADAHTNVPSIESDSIGPRTSGEQAHVSVGWNMGMSLHFEADESGPVSVHGERTQTLYVAWSSVAKVVEIGAHFVPAKSATVTSKDSKEVNPPPLPRKVQTVFQVGVADVPALAGTAINCLLGIAPFGDHFAVLGGTGDRSLLLARVPRQPPARDDEEGESDDDSHLANSLLMSLPYQDVAGAGVHAIPGGEPLVLVVVEKKENSEDVLGNGGEDDAVHRDDAGDLGKSSLETELVATSRRESFGLDGDGSVASPEGCVVFARALTLAERVKWLLERSMFAEALRAAEIAPRGSLQRADISVADVGDQFLEHIRATGDFERLADVLPGVVVSTSPSIAIHGHDTVVRIRRQRWEHWIDLFQSTGNINLVASKIPCFEPRMDKNLYNEILTNLAKGDPVTFLKVLRSWPADVYDVELVTKAAEEQSAALLEAGELESKGDDNNAAALAATRESLFMLYGLCGRHAETLKLLLVEKSPLVFDYIKAHNLYEAIATDEIIEGLYTVDMPKSTELLLNAPGTLLSYEAVLPIFKSIGNREWLCSFLHATFRQDQDRAATDHNLLLELLVDHGAEGALYSFLRISSHFSLDHALKLMGGRGGKGNGLFGRERVFVLATMGDLNSAMNILLTELHDINGAIEFASEHGDKALWDRLIEHARGDAGTLAALLDSPAGGKVNPVRLIPLIASDMEIPHLRDRLHRILVDASLERVLREETAAALHFDATKLMRQLDESVTYSNF